MIEEEQDAPKPIREKVKKERSLSINIGTMSDNDKKLKGQITTNENEEVVRVNWSVYRRYFNYIGGCKQILITNFVMACFICSKVYCDYLVGAWANLGSLQA